MYFLSQLEDIFKVHTYVTTRDSILYLSWENDRCPLGGCRIHLPVFREASVRDKTHAVDDDKKPCISVFVLIIRKESRWVRSNRTSPGPKSRECDLIGVLNTCLCPVSRWCPEMHGGQGEPWHNYLSSCLLRTWLTLIGFPPFLI